MKAEEDSALNQTTHSSTTVSEVVKKCKACGELVVGSRKERIEHKNSCPAIAAAEARMAAQQQEQQHQHHKLEPLPVCSFCGKLFRSAALLGEHQCAWKPSVTPEPGVMRRKSPFDESLDVLRPSEQRAFAGLGKTQRVLAENRSLTDYDNRMKRLLQKKHLVDPDGRPTQHSTIGPHSSVSSAASTMRSTRSSSSMSFAGAGAERAVCAQCGKGLLTTMMKQHLTTSCLVTQMRQKLDCLEQDVEKLVAASSGAITDRSQLSPRQRMIDLPPAAAIEFDIVEILGAIASVVPLRSKFRDVTGRVIVDRVRGSLPQIRSDFEAWADSRAKLAAVTKAPSVWDDPTPAVPSLRKVLHHAPFEVAAVQETKVADEETLRRCADLTLRDAARASKEAFDRDILALAAAVRRGDITLHDAAALQPGQTERALESSSYSNAINPNLRA